MGKLLHCMDQMGKPLHCMDQMVKPLHCMDQMDKHLHCMDQMDKHLHCMDQIDKHLHCMDQTCGLDEQMRSQKVTNVEDGGARGTRVRDWRDKLQTEGTHSRLKAHTPD